MGIFRELRGVADTALLTTATIRAEKQYAKDTYGPLALSLGRRALEGSCDPIVAEATLNNHLATEPESFAYTPQGERGAKALERLVLDGTIDPLFAEDVLNHDFSKWSVRGALEQIITTN